MQYREGSSPVNAVGGKRCALRRLGVAVALALGTAAAAPGVWAQQLTGELVDSARSTVFEGAIVRLQEL
ncbi:MAG TPA: hypothetical protein DEG86_08115, partial [Halieaceae bacterium]|nr:hypothetical protein [Halieaceae bacterium]